MKSDNEIKASISSNEGGNGIVTVLLIIIFLAFSSVSLPSALLGVAWPAIQQDFDVSLSAAGLVLIFITSSTIFASLVNSKLVEQFGTAKVVFFSTALMAGALIGFSVAPSFYWTFLPAIPMGFATGTLDVSLSHYVAVRYKAHHMNWMHCIWGAGATAGPVIMSKNLQTDASWRGGYLTSAIIVAAIAFLVLMVLPLWRKIDQRPQSSQMIHSQPDLDQKHETANPVKPIQIRGVKFTLAAILLYCGVEISMGLWGSSYLVQIHGLQAATAGRYISLYFAGITFGRFIAGLLTFRISNQLIIRISLLISLIGVALLFFASTSGIYILALCLIGLGLAAIFPSMIYDTLRLYGSQNAQVIIGYQIAMAYVGILILPPGLGWLASRMTLSILPSSILIGTLAVLICTEIVNYQVSRKQPIV